MREVARTVVQRAAPIALAGGGARRRGGRGKKRARRCQRLKKVRSSDGEATANPPGCHGEAATWHRGRVEANRDGGAGDAAASL